jgi:hypothetical protein
VGEPQPGLDWEPAGPKPETEQPAAYITAFPLAGLARGMAVIRIDDLPMVESRKRCQRHEERRIIQQRVCPDQFICQGEQLRLQHRIPQRCCCSPVGSRHHEHDSVEPNRSRSPFRAHHCALINTPNYFAVQFG